MDAVSLCIILNYFSDLHDVFFRVNNLVTVSRGLKI